MIKFFVYALILGCLGYALVGNAQGNMIKNSAAVKLQEMGE